MKKNKDFPMDKLRKAVKEFPQAKNLLTWERKQKRSNEKIGFAYGMITAGVMILSIYFLLVWLLK